MKRFRKADILPILALLWIILPTPGCYSGSTPAPTAEVEGAIGTPKPVTTYYVHIHDEGHNYDYWQRTSLPQSVGSNIWTFTNLFSPPRVVTIVNPRTIYWEENE